jgi:hypothetical protein
LPSKIMNYCPALENTVLFEIVSNEWYRCSNYLEPGIIAERCFYISFYTQPNDCQFYRDSFLLIVASS